VRLQPSEFLARLPLPATARWPDGVRFIEAFVHAGLELELYAPRGSDAQGPHSRDEIYLVTAGSAALDIDGVEHDCTTGDALFVPARTPHHFVRISGDFATWVVFWGEAKS
jgi:mannose-6-phosphate isomerase-like protein (cupin superfamily)